MSWEDILKIVLAILTSFGGVGGILAITIKYSSNVIAKRLEEKYKLKMNKELEKYKSTLTNKTYISKTKFDTEFSIYKSLSKRFFELVDDTCLLIPEGVSTSEEEKDADWDINTSLRIKVRDDITYLKEELYSNSPFIPGNIFSKYHDILKYCEIQASIYDDRSCIDNYFTEIQKKELNLQDNKRVEDLNDKFSKLNEDVRKYLYTLDVLE